MSFLVNLQKLFSTRNSTQNILQNRRGMTLVEIMIVLAIIGTIIALLTGNLTGALDKSKQREAKIMMGQITQALQLYYTDCSKYPKALDGLTNADSDCSNWGPEAYYKKKKGFKDPWNNEIVYEMTGSGYILKSLGKDGKEGGTAYNADISADESEDSKSE